MAPQAVAAGRWTERRRRAAELTERWPFAAEVLTFYGALLAVQERVWEAAQTELFDPSQTAVYVAERALPPVLAVTISSGPEKLARAAADMLSPGGDPPAGISSGGQTGRPHGGGLSASMGEDKVRGWLEGQELSAVDRYLMRAAAGPVLEALGPALTALATAQPRHAGAGLGAGLPGRDQRRCPRCGGLPQVSVFAASGEDLVAPRRYLECARCAWRWPYPRMTCPACGETQSQRLQIFAEEGTTQVEATGQVIRGTGGAAAGFPSGPAPRFPHVSVHACRTCSRYLLNVDLSRDARAVPVVDEMASIPLDLYAREQGFVKIVPNLAGL